MTKTNFLLLALMEAKKGRGFCAPNPAVGAVIVKDNRILATGYHHGAGKPHAEVEVVNRLDDADCAGAEIYVTLEPCCHHGRTPPCTDLLIQKKFKKVYYGYADPNPMVAGKGVAQLIKAGIACQQLEVEEINRFYQSYSHWTKTKKSFVTAKIALSLDGKIGLKDAPVKLTGNIADAYTHQQRLFTDAILSTVKTVIADNPQFNARTPDGSYKKKLFLIDSELVLPLNSKIFQTTESIGLFLQEGNLAKYQGAKAIQCIEVGSDIHGLKLQEVFDYLSAQGFHDVWVEAGAGLLNQLLQQGLINKLLLYFTPCILGLSAIPAFSQTYDLPTPNWSVLGQDVLAEFNVDVTRTDVTRIDVARRSEASPGNPPKKT